MAQSAQFLACWASDACSSQCITRCTQATSVSFETTPFTCVYPPLSLSCTIQNKQFEIEIKRHTLVHEQLIQFFKGFKHDAHPMAIMVSWGCPACLVGQEWV